MSEQETPMKLTVAELTVSEYIQRLSKELNILGTKGLFGNELELIALVRNCQFLYDKNLPDFKNIQKKNEAWEAIAAVFGVSVGEVQQRWKGMRDLFNKHRTKSEGSGPNNKNVVCPYFDDLKFLEPHIIGRRTRLSGVSVSLSDHLNSDEDSVKDNKTNILNGTGNSDTATISSSLSDLKQFIERIKDAPILYHHKYAGGSFGKQKVDQWLEISKTFGVPVAECLARWRTLRERYSRERRMHQSGVAVRKWELFDDLSFLDQHVKARRRYRYTRIIPNASSGPNVCYVVTSSPNPSVAMDSPNFLNDITSTKKEVGMDDVQFLEVSSDITSSPTPLFNEENNLSDVNMSDNPDNLTNGQNESLQTNNNNNNNIKSNLDEDDLFGQTVAAELRRIPCPRKKIKLKAEIFRLIYEHTD